MPTSQVMLQPGEVLNILGNRLTFRVTAEQTGGAYSLVEYEAAPGYPGPAPHIHETFEEVFFVLEGAPTFLLEGETIVGAPGMVVTIPRGKVHTFGNPGSSPARFLTISAPAGFELYFKELAELINRQNGPLDMAALLPEMQKISVRYDSIPVGEDQRR